MKEKIITGLCILMALMLINSGLNKFFNYMDLPKMSMGATATMIAFSKSGWLMQLVAVVEIAGGILFALPKYRPLGVIVLLPVIVGILLFHIVQEPSGLVPAIIMTALAGYVIFENQDRYKPMIKG
jgi:putative oxidoreductase